jgi:succinyl-CoA synthetase beta subunit
LICDCKVNIDENARFRHEKLFEMEDLTQIDQKEIEAAKYDLNYIRLDGNIGCMVNGAGLAMATMDLIKYKGGAPANFLDVGGKASGETVAGAMKILNDDPQVEAILVNIFAGITR